MKCEWVRQNILLYVYNELADDARYELEQHTERCAECATELKSTRQFQTDFSQFPMEDPAPNLLASSRMKLQESLETAEQGGFWQKILFDPAAWLRQIRFSPALAAAIFIVGFGGGIGATYQIVKRPIVEPIIPATESSIAGISSISQEPGTNQISIKYNTVSTQEAQGSLNDQRIQQLLLFAARNNYNSGVRMDSVDLLTQRPSDANIREVLMYALRYDSNPGVRLKALDGLGAHVKDDVRVRDTLLEALMNDANSGVRTEALHMLDPVRADSSVRFVMQQLAKSDRNPYIRLQAQNMLAQVSQIN